MDDERRKQIEEEERYRAEVRAKFEREDATPTVEERPVKKRNVVVAWVILQSQF